MAKVDILSKLYAKKVDPMKFQFDLIQPPAQLESIFDRWELDELYTIASSIKYATKSQMKRKRINEILERRAFKRLGSGTNRVVYRFEYDTSFIVKIALDRVGLTDSPREYQNQILLKPYITKVFQVAAGGAIASFERVQPIVSREEFYNIGNDIYNLLTEIILGKYVIDDIGASYFMNYGIRTGFGPVLLDFPYVFELDGDKLFCNEIVNGSLCGGQIDYDPGFNKLVCTKCGKRYTAKDLAKDERTKFEDLIRTIGGCDMKMNVVLKRGDDILSSQQINSETEIIDTNLHSSRKLIVPGKTQDISNGINMVVRGETKKDFLDRASQIRSGKDVPKKRFYNSFNNNFKSPVEMFEDDEIEINTKLLEKDEDFDVTSIFKLPTMISYNDDQTVLEEITKPIEDTNEFQENQDDQPEDDKSEDIIDTTENVSSEPEDQPIDETEVIDEQQQSSSNEDVKLETQVQKEQSIDEYIDKIMNASEEFSDEIGQQYIQTLIDTNDEIDEF